jgi:DNA-binding Lrp family transcriptional regulator
MKRRFKMSVRAYVLLDITEGNSEYAVETLRSWDGVIFADRLEGHPDVIATVQAPTRQELAEAIMPVIGSVDAVTEDLHLLVTQDKLVPAISP